MIRKQSNPSGNTILVKFILPEAIRAQTAFLVGDFNEWDETATPMKRSKNGSFMVILELNRGHDYQFRYLVDGTEWHNDWHADKYVPNPFVGDNSVVIT